MSKIVDLETRRHAAGHKRKETQARELKDAFRSARQAAESKDESAAKLLKLFTTKTPKKP